MGIKSFQVKLVCAEPSHREFLDITHRLFNEHLPPILSILYAARRGDHGPEYKQILSTIRSAQAAKEHVEAISSLESRPGDGGKDDWKAIARSLLSRGRILFDREALLPGFSCEFRRKVFEMCFQIILSHESKMAQWREDHEVWLKERAEWESRHPEYLRVLPVIQQFMDAEGKVSKRRGRWRRWLDFLTTHPELAAWRGAPPHVEPLTPDDVSAASLQPRKWIPRLFERFWAKNPELRELDRLHGEYDRRFLRSWATRKHVDGFRHSPTLTLPSPGKHPAWFSFKKNETYRHLDLATRSIDLKVIRSIDPDQRSPKGYTTYRFVPDHRLARLKSAPAPVNSNRIRCNLVYHPDDGGPPRPACIQGAKLVYRNNQPYLYFSVYIEDLPSRLSLSQKSFDKYSCKWVSQKVRKELGEDPVTMAIDLGIRHLAAATVFCGDHLRATRFLHHVATSPVTGRKITGIPTLDQIAAMKRQLRRALRKRGKPVHGEESCRHLSAHLRRMSQDRFKKSARAIVDLARFHKVDIILLEKLKGLVPDAEKERGINRALLNWNRAQTARWVRMLAEEYGIRVLEVPPYYTSQICHRCDQPGYRYTINDGAPATEPVGKLFACPACGYRCNADFNAAINIHRVFRGTFPEIRSLGSGRFALAGRQVDLKQVRDAVDAALQAEHLASHTPF